MYRFIRLKTAKVRNRRGASMAIALLYFLICAMVGSVILAAASANVSHVKMEKRNEANYLAVMSAAELLKAQLKDCAGQWESDPVVFDEAADEDERMEFKKDMMDQILLVNDGMAVKQALIQHFYQTYLNCLKGNELRVSNDSGDSESFVLTFERSDVGILSDSGERSDGKERAGGQGASEYEIPPVTVTFTVIPDNVVLNSRNSQQLHVNAAAYFSIADESSGQYLMNLNMGGLIHYTLDEDEETETDPVTGVTSSDFYYTSQVIFSPDEPYLSGGGKTGGSS